MSNRDKTAAHRTAVCDAAADLFEQRNSLQLPTRWAPDEQDRQSPAVDLKCRGPAANLVIEHTLVETIPNQIAHGRMCVQLLAPLETELKDALPTPGHYVLTANPAECEGLKDGARARALVTAWIHEQAPKLKLGGQGRTGHFVEGVPAGTQLHLTLARWAHWDGRLLLYFLTPEELMAKRREQMRVSLDKKCPKLRAAREDGAVSLLVLESNDIALGDDAEIARALVLELSAREDDVPDHMST